MAKDAYRATNSKDEYPQMTAWLDRRERIMLHSKFIRRRSELRPQTNNVPQSPMRPVTTILPSLVYRREHYMAKHPTKKGVTLNTIKDTYHAKFFDGALARFVAQYQNPTFTVAQVQQAATSVHVPAYRFPVYHRLKFVMHDPYKLNLDEASVVDSIHVEPGRFDTAVIFYTGGTRNTTGVQGTPYITSFGSND